MQCESVQGRRLPDVHGREDETGLWKEPPGTWRWRIDGYAGKRIMEAVLPTKYPEGPGMVHPYLHCSCVVETDNPDPRRFWEWDGNEEAPTLSPSIMVDTHWGEDWVRVFWHGYMKAGHFQACE